MPKLGCFYHSQKSKLTSIAFICSLNTPELNYSQSGLELQKPGAYILRKYRVGADYSRFILATARKVLILS